MNKKLEALQALASKGEFFTQVPYWENTGGYMMVIFMQFTPAAAELMSLPGKFIAIGDECASFYHDVDAFYEGEDSGEGSYICDSSKPTKEFKSLDIDWPDRFDTSSIHLVTTSGLNVVWRDGVFDICYEDIVLYTKGLSSAE